MGGVDHETEGGGWSAVWGDRATGLDVRGGSRYVTT